MQALLYTPEGEMKALGNMRNLNKEEKKQT